MNTPTQWLIVGLGNPGSNYTFNRHNIGFMVIDFLLKSIGSPIEKSEHKSITSKFKLENIHIITAKPQTYMNRSGEAVQGLTSYYKIPSSNIIVIQDDIDQGFGKMKLHRNRGHGGHNGIRSITESLGSSDYYRVKLGVGRPQHPSFSVADYVLQNFSENEMNELPEILNKATQAIEHLITHGYSEAATQFNT